MRRAAAAAAASRVALLLTPAPPRPAALACSRFILRPCASLAAAHAAPIRGDQSTGASTAPPPPSPQPIAKPAPKPLWQRRKGLFLLWWSALQYGGALLLATGMQFGLLPRAGLVEGLRWTGVGRFVDLDAAAARRLRVPGTAVDVDPQFVANFAVCNVAFTVASPAVVWAAARSFNVVARRLA